MIGFYGYPQTFYTTANGYPLIAVEIDDQRNKGMVIKGVVPSRDPDFETSDHYSTTKIWVDKTKPPLEGFEMSGDRQVQRLWRGSN